MIARNNLFPQISLSPQLILDCDTSDNYGCYGGDALGVYRFIHENGMVEDSCSPYVAQSWYTSNRECNDYSYCSYSTSTTSTTENEYLYNNYPRFYVDEFGYTVNGEESMLKLLQEGPIVCSMAVTDDFYYNYNGGIFQDNTGYLDTDHEIALVGYGITDDSTKYWIAMNSWGTSLSFNICIYLKCIKYKIIIILDGERMDIFK